MSCGHRFEVSRVVAESSVNMTLCPRCAAHEIETLGDGSRESAPQPVPAKPAPAQPDVQSAAPAKPTVVQPAAEQPAAPQTASEQPAAGEDAA
jgi:hypothetical protein